MKKLVLFLLLMGSFAFGNQNCPSRSQYAQRAGAEFEVADLVAADARMLFSQVEQLKGSKFSDVIESVDIIRKGIECLQVNYGNDLARFPDENLIGGLASTDKELERIQQVNNNLNPCGAPSETDATRPIITAVAVQGLIDPEADKSCGKKLLEDAYRFSEIEEFGSVGTHLIDEAVADSVFAQNVEHFFRAMVKKRHLFSNDAYTFEGLRDEVCKQEVETTMDDSPISYTRNLCGSDENVEQIMRVAYEEEVRELQGRPRMSRERKRELQTKINYQISEMNRLLNVVRGKAKNNGFINIFEDDYSIACNENGEIADTTARDAYEKYRNIYNGLFMAEQPNLEGELISKEDGDVIAHLMMKKMKNFKKPLNLYSQPCQGEIQFDLPNQPHNPIFFTKDVTDTTDTVNSTRSELAARGNTQQYLQSRSQITPHAFGKVIAANTHYASRVCTHIKDDEFSAQRRQDMIDTAANLSLLTGVGAISGLAVRGALWASGRYLAKKGAETVGKRGALARGSDRFATAVLDSRLAQAAYLGVATGDSIALGIGYQEGKARLEAFQDYLAGIDGLSEDELALRDELLAMIEETKSNGQALALSLGFLPFDMAGMYAVMKQGQRVTKADLDDMKGFFQKQNAIISRIQGNDDLNELFQTLKYRLPPKELSKLADQVGDLSDRQLGQLVAGVKARGEGEDILTALRTTGDNLGVQVPHPTDLNQLALRNVRSGTVSRIKTDYSGNNGLYSRLGVAPDSEDGEVLAQIIFLAEQESRRSPFLGRPRQADVEERVESLVSNSCTRR